MLAIYAIAPIVLLLGYTANNFGNWSMQFTQDGISMIWYHTYFGVMWCLDVDARGLRGEVCWLGREGDDRDVKKRKKMYEKQLRMPKTITARKSNCSLWRPPFHNSWVTSWQGGSGAVRSRANQSRPTDTTLSVFQSRAEQKCLRANYGKKQTAGGGKVNVGRLIVSHTILPPSFWQIGR